MRRLPRPHPRPPSEALDGARLPERTGAARMGVGAPVARPAAVLCSGQNHAVRAAESGVQTPQQPVSFLKHPNTIVGAYDDILLPPGSHRTDWEVEPVLALGRRAHYLVSHLSSICCWSRETSSTRGSPRASRSVAGSRTWPPATSSRPRSTALADSPRGPGRVT